MTAEFLEKTKELEEKIKKLQFEEENKEEEIEDLEYQLDCEQQELEDIQDDLYKLQQQLDDIYLEYCPAMMFVDYSRDNTKGQSLKDGLWRVCNGYVLIESKTKFESVDEIQEGVNTSISEMIKNKEKHIITGNSITELAYTNDQTRYIVDDKWMFNKVYVDNSMKVVTHNEGKLIEMSYYIDTERKGALLVLQGDNVSALILGMRDI